MKQKEKDRIRNIYNERVKALKEITSGHRKIIFGDCADEPVCPEGVVFECKQD